MTQTERYHTNVFVVFLKVISAVWWLVCCNVIGFATVQLKHKYPQVPFDGFMLSILIPMALLIMMSITPMRWLRKSRIVYWACFAIACGISLLFTVGVVCANWSALAGKTGPAPDWVAFVLLPLLIVGLLLGTGSVPATFVLSHIANRQLDDVSKKSEPSEPDDTRRRTP